PAHTTGLSVPPGRPGLSLAGVRLAAPRRHRWGFPCFVGSPCVPVPSPLPREDRWVRVSFDYPSDGGLPRYSGGSAPPLPVSRPAQRSLMLRPVDSPSPPEATLNIGSFGSFVTSSTDPHDTRLHHKERIGIS